MIIKNRFMIRMQNISNILVKYIKFKNRNLRNKNFRQLTTFCVEPEHIIK